MKGLNLTTILKILVTVIPLYIIFDNLDLEITIQLIRKLEFSSVMLAVFALLFQILLMSHRWKVVLNNLSMQFCYRDVLCIFWVGLFFNQILPTSVGGDAFRGYYLYKRGYSLQETTQGVLIDRVVGLVALVSLTILTLPLGLQLIDDQNAKWGLTLLVLVSMLGLFLLLNIGLVSRKLMGWELLDKVVSIMTTTKESIFSFNPGFQLLVASLVVHLCSILAMVILASGMQLNIDTIDLIVIVPIVTLLMMVPVSIAGWGIREGAMIVGLSFLGVVSEDALALSLMFGFLMLVLSIPGCLIWIVIGKEKNFVDVKEESSV